ncbi:MAG: choice-of-anchor D domain-containing protein, partial [Candidatus Kapaibacterium sp.]
MRTFPFRAWLLAVFLSLSATVELGAQYWQKCSLPAPYSAGYYLDVFFLPSNPQYGWVCGHEGYVLRTTDGGTTWQGTLVPYQGRSGGHLESVHFVTQQTGYCSGPCGVFKSTDGGASWSDITPSMPGNQSPWGLYFLNATWGVVVGGGCGGTQGFVLTTNGGASWSSFTGSLPASGMTDALLYADGRGFAVGSGQLWNTLDSGRTWSPFKAGFASIWNEEIAHIGASFLLPWAGSQCAGGGGGGGGRFTTDSGATWTTYSTGQPMYGSFLVNATTGWICGNARSMYKTTDAGANWELKNCGIDGDLDDCWFINDTTGFVVGNAVYRYMPPERSISKIQSTLGPVCYPGTLFDTVWVRNRSFNGTSATWNLAGTDIQHFNVLQPASTSFGIPACDSAMIVLRFQPRSPGTKTITLSVTVNNQVTFTTVISGTTRVVNAVPTDTVFTVRPAPCGTPVRLVTTWNNSSSLTDQVIQVTRLSGDMFTVDPGLPFIIPPGGGSVQASIVLADTGWKTGRYLFRVGPCLKDTVITLRAYGVSPIVNTPLSRRYQTACLQAAYDSIPVLNTGNADLLISATDIVNGTGEFTVVGWNTGESLPVMIPPGTTKYVYIRYAPKGSGASTATLRLATNDATTARGAKRTVDIALNGESGGVKYALSSTSLDFGRHCVPAFAERSWSVVNTGTSPVTLSSSGSAASPFTVTASRTLPSAIGPGDSLRVRVVFQSSVAGVFRDSLVFGISPCDSVPIVIPLKAEAIRSVIDIAPARLQRSLRRGTVDTVCVDVRSLGPSEAVIDSLLFDPPLRGARIISGGTVPVRVDSGSALRVCIEVSGDSVGTWSGVLRARGATPCVTAASVPLELIVNDARLSIGPTGIDLPVVRCAPMVRRDTIVITNDGSVADTLTDARITAAGATAFSIVFPKVLPKDIPPSSRLLVIIQSSQTAEGVDTARCDLRFATAFGGAVFSIPLRSEYRAAMSSLRDTVIDAGMHEPCDLPVR